jgi:ABC-2 type transport system permease protein
MNSSFAEIADAPSAAAVPAALPPGRVLFTLLRRELWEHRYLWIGPLCVAALLALCALVGQVHLGLPDLAQLASEPTKVALLTVVQWVLSATFLVLTLFIVSNYALDCLYAERKDRSILFWKSLPVSDGLTVGAKLLMALLVVPLGVFAISVPASLVFFAIVSVRTALGSIPAIMTWNTLEWLRTEIAMLLILLLAMLWYAPLVAYLMVVSAWARRRPFLISTLPWVLAPILERIAFGTRYLWHFLSYRSNGIFATLAAGHTHIFSHHGFRPVGTLLDELNFRGAFTDIDLWLGLAAAAALLYAAARIRRYRDDT